MPVFLMCVWFISWYMYLVGSVEKLGPSKFYVCVQGAGSLHPDELYMCWGTRKYARTMNEEKGQGHGDG